MKTRFPRRPAQGFILIYVVGMLAAIAALILHVQQTRNATPRQLEKHIQKTLQDQEIDGIIDFLQRQAEKPLDTDPRYIRYQAILQDKRLDDLEQNSEFALLKAMLSQVGFQIADRPATAKAGAAGDPNRILDAEGRPAFPLDLGQRDILLGANRYRIQVESGNARPNLNAIPYEPLWRLLKVLKFDEAHARQLAANLVDWRDPDTLRTDGIGQESDHYQSLDPPYPAPDKAIATWQELAYVDGVTPEILTLLRHNFSLGEENAGYATLFAALDPARLAALLDMDPARAARLYQRLREAEKQPYNEGDPDPRQRILDELGADDREKFDAAVTWAADSRRIRITFSGSDTERSLDYDTRRRRILARW